MKFTSQIWTSRSQSERLLALGLKKETADMVHVGFGGGNFMSRPYEWRSTTQIDMEGFIPAWSLHRLIEMMPTVITYDDYHLILGVNSTCVYYANDEYAESFKAFEGNLYECVVKCIEWLIEEYHFNKEYLEEL